MAENFVHKTVLLQEAVSSLQVKPDGKYVDCTLGGGGHSTLIAQKLTSAGHLYAFDQDETAIQFNLPRFKNLPVTLIAANFREIKRKLTDLNVNKVDGILYDLGVSSPQFDDAKRGFSYRFDAPLDMRMDRSQKLNAEIVVNDWPYEKLVKIFWRYGEEKYAKSIARHIEKARIIAPIKTTGELVELIKAAIPARARRTGGHPAKRVFQAIRIAVNDELGALEDSLSQALDLLSPGGRICVITFQSLEDRLVKTMFKEKTSLPDLPAGLPVVPIEMEPNYRLVTRKPILPTEVELEHNHRAHSARLRIIERK
ncbi:MAG: 16S rRNA (cytosine(1402)-N(4))-methyltransferase RsmH [Liquorilactobacillus nagelii]|uniref:16S rRNA (cytosine(1402)-N(4))-methyltransferase RsmH n=1 Tax=Liquorilactobacillus nagelii TaxID=82688 RepID=UPI001CCBDEBB|nr:16S rRNA (cytosine(1402)-N(4))-methyltransferase RsmH [Liquorilactobacillus nagelii]MCI1634466.1 16S rRNA (cytosine(1402)-N(4))-methyltransferase RsmH [Liquorilactobacillus nagelii]MCI1920379.1 16S rRNA (cytosine(1402)-N(4))-methyltransferase RsmH [Liquorilactobacillus nagelii]MCI1976023.1 16S rRNA (cytosine(1402)-N(4))-methyltransferase RsmH [Liquorilactobacillus nagelii]ULQ49771.1 16S rRNA (cytosine(1402)-N(4))-methyltransferase RsmH [Liquorilactobacillus nagelii]